MSYTYLQQRPQLVAFACNVGEALALPGEHVAQRSAAQHAAVCRSGGFALQLPGVETLLPM